MAINDPYSPGSYEHGSGGVSSGGFYHFCGHCGLHHGAVCPRIKVIEYYLDGSLKRVEYR